ncbi:hypothetical protein O3P69_016238 [Scylla paramamosain]|uniref:Uncharacterized protein n=1 Tax=Scylla paramamosain TaxID=85552 RepID=A0AAW0S9I0_SCYPA
MARRARSEGLLLFSISVPPHQIKEETYIPLLTCNTCYAIEDHSTKQCPCPQGYKAHSCMAMRCPARKKAYKEKEERLRMESTRSTSISYAQAASSPASEGTQGLNLTGLVCVMHAHMAIIRAITGKMSPVQDPQEGPAPSQPGRDSSSLATDGDGYSSSSEEEESDPEGEEVDVEDAPSVTAHTQFKRTSPSPQSPRRQDPPRPSKSEPHSERSQHAGPPPEQRTRTSRQRKQVRPKTGR